ncbi:hypothetical protein B0H13DRAFT_1890629 [Mycena leptocephala]|nr:hypothetical protein B0H13DRAFT_1890629 [Mycena leptocephala]
MTSRLRSSSSTAIFNTGADDCVLAAMPRLFKRANPHHSGDVSAHQHAVIHVTLEESCGPPSAADNNVAVGSPGLHSCGMFVSSSTVIGSSSYMCNTMVSDLIWCEYRTKREENTAQCRAKTWQTQTNLALLPKVVFPDVNDLSEFAWFSENESGDWAGIEDLHGTVQWLKTFRMTPKELLDCLEHEFEDYLSHVRWTNRDSLEIGGRSGGRSAKNTGNVSRYLEPHLFCGFRRISIEAGEMHAGVQLLSMNANPWLGWVGMVNTQDGGRRRKKFTPEGALSTFLAAEQHLRLTAYEQRAIDNGTPPLRKHLLAVLLVAGIRSLSSRPTINLPGHRGHYETRLLEKTRHQKMLGKYNH